MFIEKLSDPGEHKMKMSKSNWTRTRIIKSVIIGLGLVVILSVLGFGAFAITSTSGFCTTCHEMKPEYLTWRVSSHSQISCTNCHGPITAVAQRLFQHVTGNYNKPIKEKQPISQQVCLQCHKPDRVINVGIDLKIPHLRHISKGILCVSCHSGLVHGHISERGLNTKDATKKWDTKKAKELADSNNTNVSMEQCIECHRNKKIAINCDTCHANFSKPKTHTRGEWLEDHGLVARNKVGLCNDCHSYTNEKRLGSKVVSFKNPATNYARNNTFCNGCHTAKKPSSHEEPWNIKHAELFQEGIVECYVCHDQTVPKSDYAVERIYCNKCHGKFAVSLDITNIYQ